MPNLNSCVIDVLPPLPPLLKESLESVVFSKCLVLHWVFLSEGRPTDICKSWIFQLPQHCSSQYCPEVCLFPLPLLVFFWWANIFQALFLQFTLSFWLYSAFSCFSLSWSQAVNTTYWTPAVKDTKGSKAVFSFLREPKIYLVRQNIHSH